jgi:hypothetical protein
MIPDIDVQLQVIIKSLKDNVLPAVDSANQLAQQQIQLSLAALEITRNHLPLVHALMRRDIAEHIAVAEKLQAVCLDKPSLDALADAIGRAQAALADPALGFIQLQEEARLLREGVGAAITNNADTPQAEAVEKVILQTSTTPMMLGRAWNKPMGFEPDPRAVPDLAEQLGAGN